MRRDYEEAHGHAHQDEQQALGELLEDGNASREESYDGENYFTFMAETVTEKVNTINELNAGRES